MKKCLAFMLVICMALTLAACGKPEISAASDPASPQTEQTETTAPFLGTEAAGETTAPSPETEATGETTAPSPETEATGETTAPSPETEAAGETTAPFPGTEETEEPEIPTTQSPEASIPYLQKISRPDQSIFDGPGYDYGFAGTVELAGIYTIVEEARDEEGNLWGRLKSGAGWVDLTDIRSGDSERAPITANYADDRLLNTGNYHHCIADTSEYRVRIAFRANELLKDVCFFSLEFWGDSYQMAEELYYLEEMHPDKPLVADVAFPGDMSMYGIRLTGTDGTIYHYSVSISGRNGALVLSEYVPEA